MKADHRCPRPCAQGYCSECRRIRQMTTDEFMDWFAAKYGKHRCPRDPTHLVESSAHEWECKRRHAGGEA